MRIILPTRCEASTYDGHERKRCTRPGSVDRDGRTVCRVHVALERVIFVDGSKSIHWQAPTGELFASTRR